MKRIMVLTAVLLMVGGSALLARQDPDDPGIQDSVIFLCSPDRIDSSDAFQYRYLQILAVTDDSVMFYNLPVRWHAPRGGVICAPGTTYNWPIVEWDEHYDTVMSSQGYVRQTGWAVACGSPHPPLQTNGQRLHAWSLRFIIAPNTPSQLVVFDTCWDDRNGSVVFVPDQLGEIEITPAVQRGFLSIVGTVGTAEGTPLPGVVSLTQNHPNPFNAQTTIEYSLKQDGPVELAIFDMAGRRVATLCEGDQAAGKHRFMWDAEGLPSGIYFCRLTAGLYTETKKMTILK